MTNEVIYALIIELLSILLSYLFWSSMRELGVTKVIFEKLKFTLSILGDIAYGVGISVVASVLYAATGIEGMFATKMLVGVSLIFFGSILKR